jgi:hypothetical protein
MEEFEELSGKIDLASGVGFAEDALFKRFNITV